MVLFIERCGLHRWVVWVTSRALITLAVVRDWDLVDVLLAVLVIKRTIFSFFSSAHNYLSRLTLLQHVLVVYVRPGFLSFSQRVNSLDYIELSAGFAVRCGLSSDHLCIDGFILPLFLWGTAWLSLWHDQWRMLLGMELWDSITFLTWWLTSPALAILRWFTILSILMLKGTPCSPPLISLDPIICFFACDSFFIEVCDTSTAQEVHLLLLLFLG